ncbi:hypothetical protein [Vibrio harveyi]
MGVPKELRDTIGNTEFKTPLPTKNLTEAKRLLPRIPRILRTLNQ